MNVTNVFNPKITLICRVHLNKMRVKHLKLKYFQFSKFRKQKKNKNSNETCVSYVNNVPQSKKSLIDFQKANIKFKGCLKLELKIVAVAVNQIFCKEKKLNKTKKEIQVVKDFGAYA